MTVHSSRWSHTKGHASINAKTSIRQKNDSSGPLRVVERNCAICLSNIASSSLRSRGQRGNDGTNSLKSTPGTREIIGTHRRVDGTVRISQRRHKREGKVLDDAKFPRLPRFWYN